ncbi:proline dehydrogenase [Actinoalloteichus sp. AHMU CJ021]|uniref:L-proline dehydrogenase n=1 Tax=Actinoalloteichus caeruleus DSM 43889 TaxID=1120930 RepID=A0ABT1JLD7_ACTCY|nr:hypothetical protein [Actinoalloteichus caeruleus]AUS79070.1 proline dehydrogenase [Actinoalloteichus sp. AHMU CJ021]MCP2333315.1 L-proline dehydrogenase (EC 1.5.99.8) [Actinoalloteichus caeruleus DSM 43889]
MPSRARVLLTSAALAAARNDAVRGRSVVTRRRTRQNAGKDAVGAVLAARRLVARFGRVRLDHLVEGATDRGAAVRATQELLDLLGEIDLSGLAPFVDVGLRPSGCGLALDVGLAEENLDRICGLAHRVGCTVTLDTEDHSSVDQVLAVAGSLRDRWRGLGVVLHANLHRTVEDCVAHSRAGSRVVLSPASHPESASVAVFDPHEVDLQYVRCARVLLAGACRPVFAARRPRLLGAVVGAARWHRRDVRSFECQVPPWMPPSDRRRLAGAGVALRAVVRFGADAGPPVVPRPGH